MRIFNHQQNPLPALLILYVLFVACNKKFDEPPVYVPPVVHSTISIAQLKANYIYGSAQQITTDDIIEGIVIANDSSGNFFKQIIIQDTSGGIAINIDDYNLFTAFPTGREVFIKLKGLYLHDDNHLIELSGSTDGNNNFIGINHTLINQYIVKGSLNNPQIAKPVSVSDLNDSYQNTLIQLDNFSFQSTDTSKTYANPVTKASVNFTLKDCSGRSVTLRNSGYASFAGIKVPSGSGSITGIYSIFGSSKQLFIRDTFDVQFNKERCSAGASGNGSLTSVANIRSMYSDKGVKLGSYKIGGVVISDAANKNINKSTIVIQDGDAGISVFIGGSTANYNPGDSVVLNVSGDSLIKYNGQMEIKKTYGSSWPDAIATNRIIVPKELTVQQLTSDLSMHEFTLVTIKDATASGGNTFSGNKTLNDASGSMTLYTSSSASFSSRTLPSDAKTWIGYATYFNSTKEFMIRNLNDVQ